jgi:hypothetical protein
MKCELTASPSYKDNKEFLEFKEALQQKVATFIKEGTEIKTEWAEINIQLLTIDCCSNILAKALQNLEDITSLFTEIIGTPTWLSLPSDKFITLFLFILYFSSEYIDITKPTECFGTVLGTKILTDALTGQEALTIMSSIKISGIDPEDPVQERLISEILTCFDQILKVTTIDIWNFHKERNKQIMAARKLTASMKSIDTVNATIATKAAIVKATKNFNLTQAQYLKSNLRLSN